MTQQKISILLQPFCIAHKTLKYGSSILVLKTFIYIQRVSFEYIKGSPLMLVLIKIRNFMPIKNQDIYSPMGEAKAKSKKYSKNNKKMLLHHVFIMQN